MSLGTTPTLLSRAPLRPYATFGRFCYSPETGDTTGEQGQQSDPVKAAATKAAPTVPDTTGKLLLTQEEIDAKVQNALSAAQAKADAKAQKDREAADRKAAEEQGKWKELADKAQSDLEAERVNSRKKDQSIALRDHLAEKHPDYVGCAKYISPLIPGDAEGDELAKAVKDAAEQYVKDNPRQAKGRAGAPGDIPGRMPARPSDSRTPRTTNNLVRPASVAASRF